MQPLLSPDLHPDGPLIGVSCGVDSAALLIYLGAVGPVSERPASVGVFHADPAEHAPDVPRFDAACVRFARGVWGPLAG